MKNRNIQFKPTAGILIPLLLACFAAVFISAPTPAIAGDMVPFKGTLSGYVTLSPARSASLQYTSSTTETRPIWDPSPGRRNFIRTVARPSGSL